MKQREIKFRAMYHDTADNTMKFAYGLVGWMDEKVVQLCVPNGKPIMRADTMNCIPGTLGQFTGLQDIQGKDIYESDKLLHPSDPNPMTVVWHERTAGFGLARNGWMYTHYFHEAVDPKECTVIGNIYELPTNTTEG